LKIRPIGWWQRSVFDDLEAGTTYVLEPTPAECKILAENKLGELTRASPAFSNGQIFIRTHEHLYCVEGK